MDYSWDILNGFLLGAILLFFMVWILRFKWKEIKHRQRALLNKQKGLKGEKIARKILSSCGYEILGEQIPLKHRYWVDGSEVSVSLAADFLVEKEGYKYLVEVKTGKMVANVEYGNTRRQLMEYYHVMDADGLLLLDVEQNRIQEVEFEIVQGKPWNGPLYWGIGVTSIVIIFLDIFWLNCAFAFLIFLTLMVLTIRNR